MQIARPHPGVSDSVGLGWSRRTCLSNMFLDDANIARSRDHTLRTTVLEGSNRPKCSERGGGVSQPGCLASITGTRPRLCCEMAKCAIPSVHPQQTSISLLLSGFVCLF